MESIGERVYIYIYILVLYRFEHAFREHNVPGKSFERKCHPSKQVVFEQLMEHANLQHMHVLMLKLMMLWFIMLMILWMILALLTEKTLNHLGCVRIISGGISPICTSPICTHVGGVIG